MTHLLDTKFKVSMLQLADKLRRPRIRTSDVAGQIPILNEVLLGRCGRVLVSQLPDKYSAIAAPGDNGRVVLRYSGSEQLARVMVEAEHEVDVQRFTQSLANALRSSIGA
jgi:phosphomannomutase